MIILHMRMTTILCFWRPYFKTDSLFSKGHYFQILYNSGIGCCFRMDDSQGLTGFVSANRFSPGTLSKYFQEEDTLSLDYKKTI